MPQGWFHIAPSNVWPLLLAATGAVALVVIALLLVLLVRQRNASRNIPRFTPAQQRALERDLTGLMNDLAEMARQVGSQLDARAVRLEELIHEADDRLRQLDDAQHAMSIAVPSATSIAARDPIPSPLPAHPALAPDSTCEDGTDPRHVEIYTLADQGLALHAIAQRLRRPSGEVELILALRPQESRASRQ